MTEESTIFAGLDPVAQVAKAAEITRRTYEAITSRLYGLNENVQRLITATLAGGHILAEGVPGVGKTEMLKAFSAVSGLTFKRVQFTPDLMPSDITGSEIYNQKSGDFETVLGPVFTQILLADEINRAGQKVQAGLLEAMAERQVSIAGKTHRLNKPFHVMATQNPVEQEGTHPLPEAQKDRFMMRLIFRHPDRESRRKIIENAGMDKTELSPIFSASDLIAMQDLVRKMPASKSVVDAMLHIACSLSPEDPDAPAEIRGIIKSEGGPSPRASQDFRLAVCATALLDGRTVPHAGDVLQVAEPVLLHRLMFADSLYNNADQAQSFGTLMKKITANIG